MATWNDVRSSEGGFAVSFEMFAKNGKVTDIAPIRILMKKPKLGSWKVEGWIHATEAGTYITTRSRIASRRRQ